jgi:hypothetical protein
MPEPRYRALLIGNAVFRRDPQGLPKLQGPRADVDALFEALTDSDSGMFAAEDVEALLDRNLQHLREELHRFFIEDATRDDVLFLYYSGHGKLDLLGRLHLCASDTRVHALPVTALRYQDDINALIESSPAASTVTVLDCCHSGAFRGGELQVAATGNGRCVITSAAANELAVDATGPGGMSPFTQVLVSGLRLPHARVHLTTRELYEYIAAELSLPGNSRPQFYFDGEGAILLARRATAAAGTAVAPEPPEPPGANRASQTAIDVVGAVTGTRSPRQSHTPFALYAPYGRPAPGTPPLPEARTHLWHLLNEAAASTMPEHDGDSEPAVTLGTLVHEAVRVDSKWSKAVVKRLGPGNARHAAIAGLVMGLTELGVEHATDFIEEVSPNTADCIVASLSLATAVAETHPVTAVTAMEEVFRSSESMPRGKLETQLLVRVLRLYTSAGVAGNSEEPLPSPVTALHSAALKATESQPGTGAGLIWILRNRIEDELDAGERHAMQADIALRLAAFNPEAAQAFFRSDDHFLPEASFQDIAPDSIAIGAASMLGADPSTAFQLFEIAERRCRSEDDRVALFDSLLSLLVSPPDSASAYAYHFLDLIERVIDEVPEVQLQRLSSTAIELARTAPRIAEALLRLDPDEDRACRALISAARAASSSDREAARRMAASAELIIGSAGDESKLSLNLVHLAAMLTLIDFGQSLRLFRSLPPGSLRHLAAVESVKVLASSDPDRINDFVALIASRRDEDSLTMAVYQEVADVRPRYAVELAASLPDPAVREAVLARAVAALAPQSPEEAESITRGIVESRLYRADAMVSIAESIAATEPHRAVRIADDIHQDADCRYFKAKAFTAAVKGAAAKDIPRLAESCLAQAEEAARGIDDPAQQCHALLLIGATAAETAPVRTSGLLAEAERLALSNPDGDVEERSTMLADLMVTWARIAPSRVERIAEQIPRDWEKRDMSLKLAVEAMAAIDPRRAERLSKAIVDDGVRLEVQSNLVKTMSASSPAKAERLALSLPPGEHRARALFVVADTLHRRRSGESLVLQP